MTFSVLGDEGMGGVVWGLDCEDGGDTGEQAMITGTFTSVHPFCAQGPLKRCVFHTFAPKLSIKPKVCLKKIDDFYFYRRGK